MQATRPFRTESPPAGDEYPVERLIEEFHSRIYAFLRRLTGNDHDAEDLTQRTFAKVCGSLGSYAGRSSVASWIHGIAHHVYLVNLSYEYLASDGIDCAQDPQRVLTRCRVHGHVGLCDGSVQMVGTNSASRCETREVNS